MPYFICPRCAWRGNRLSRHEGFSDRPAACESCGFGFLFELIEDYYPSPLAGIFVCDQQGRVLALGRGAMALAGYTEQELIGIDLEEALEIRSDDPSEQGGDPPHKTALEWGVRVLGKLLTIRISNGEVIPVTGDFFPAYDDDGGLLAVFVPRSV